jgi:hypothetical protein
MDTRIEKQVRLIIWTTLGGLAAYYTVLAIFFGRG